MTNEERELLILIARHVHKNIGDILVERFGEVTGQGARDMHKIERLTDEIQRQARSE